MTRANFKSLPFNVWEEFLGQTDIMFYITDYFTKASGRQEFAADNRQLNNFNSHEYYDLYDLCDYAGTC